MGKSGYQTKESEVSRKPGSVVDNHSSRMHVTMHLKQPDRIVRTNIPKDWLPVYSHFSSNSSSKFSSKMVTF